MPQPRKYPSNAARQAAYRARLKRRAAAEVRPERWDRAEDGSVADERGRVWDPDTKSWRLPVSPRAARTVNL